MAMLTLNGAALPDPSALSVELQDALLSARRTLSGAASVSRAAVKRRRKTALALAAVFGYTVKKRSNI